MEYRFYAGYQDKEEAHDVGASFKKDNDLIKYRVKIIIENGLAWYGLFVNKLKLCWELI